MTQPAPWPCVMLVEDSDDDRLLFGEATTAVGGLVLRHARTAALALQHLADAQAQPPTLILIDSRLPDSEGVALARLLVERHGWDGRRIVMLCGSPEIPGPRAWGLWIEKPDTWEGWERIVRAIVRHAADVDSPRPG